MTLLEINPQELTDAGILTIFGMGVVFSILLLLTLIFKLIPKILDLRIKKQLAMEGKEITIENMSMEVDMNAVIAAAIYLYLNELHDEESQNITIKKISRDYSPWSSKIYSMNLWN
jgi:Na+-transporting methylmalonyl-CoA/oxaloacetate decarboxylase gamma subunit